MNTIEPKEKYVIIHPTEDDGSELRYSFILTLSRHLGEKTGADETVGDRLIRALGTMPGIDTLNPNVGRYSIHATIARTFDPEEILNELKERLERDVLSDIIRPSQEIVTP